MGHSVGMVHIDDVRMSQLGVLDLHPSGETISGDEALSSGNPGRAARQTPRGLLILDATMVLASEDESISAALDRRVVTVLLSSTADTFSFAVSAPGAARRHIVDSQGERVVEVGTTLPEEDGTSPLVEASTLTLLERLTGVAVDDDLLWGRFDVLTDAPVTGPDVPLTGPDEGRARTGFLARLFGR
ncbi:hypothetical protein ACI3EY_06135 [Ornithinimicrobium sp. LYQ92]|uniref:hypothetical protein n=1 Tax=Serinicoccus sp. LYQ92 TaxID=3378798 RepID=UPI00385440A4